MAVVATAAAVAGAIASNEEAMEEEEPALRSWSRCFPVSPFQTRGVSCCMTKPTLTKRTARTVVSSVQCACSILPTMMPCDCCRAFMSSTLA